MIVDVDESGVPTTNSVLYKGILATKSGMQRMVVMIITVYIPSCIVNSLCPVLNS
jgi:hypothetical protein